MYETAFTIVAEGMRYLFLLLILYILVRLTQHSLREFRAVQEVKRQVRSVSPGYLEILRPEAHAGERHALKRENTIGRSKRADLSFDLASLAPLHAVIYEKRDGLYVAGSSGRMGVLLNGEPIKKRREELLYTQDTIEMGELLCKLHLRGEEIDAE